MSNQTTNRTFGQRLWWLIRTLFISLLLIAIIAAAVLGSYTVFVEVQRSFASVDTRMDAVEQNASLLREDVNNLMAGSPEAMAEMADLTSYVSAMEERVAALDTAVNDTLTTQSDRLAALEAQVADLTTQGDAVVADTAVLSDGFLALQRDINTNTTEIDALGGELDGLRGQISTVAADVTTLEATTAAQFAAAEEAEVTEVAQTLALFHVWELIGRARLRILQNNVGLATDDVAEAIRRMDAVIATVDEADALVLEQVQARLGLAFAGLPDAADTAVADLDNAWDQLDAFLVARLLPAEGVTAEETAVDGETAVETTDEGDGAADTATEATPEPTPEPTATPSP